MYFDSKWKSNKSILVHILSCSVLFNKNSEQLSDLLPAKQLFKRENQAEDSSLPRPHLIILLLIDLFIYLNHQRFPKPLVGLHMISSKGKFYLIFPQFYWDFTDV